MKYFYDGQAYDKPEPGQRFESGRWDVDAIINGDDGGKDTYNRLFALLILWKGRVSDIRDTKQEGRYLEADILEKCADELHQALQVIFGDNS